MSTVCRKARNADLPSLKTLWSDVFGESAEAVDLFFKRNLSCLHSYIAGYNGQPVAAVHLIDGTVNGKKAHYLCGAATKPEWRRRGIMSRLIEYALDDAKSRGDVYSLLYPANEGLYGFYSKLGYEPRCKAAARCFSRKELEACDFSGVISEEKPDFEALQNQCYKNNFLLQNNDFTAFAIEYYKLYGTGVVFSRNCLAFYEESLGTAQVFYCVYNDIKELKALLLKESGAEEFVFHSKPGAPGFNGGVSENAGMARLLGDGEALPGNIYIGITLS